MKNFKILLALSVLGIISCNDKTDEPSITQEIIKTGIFIDSPVANIGYKTETQSGVTNTLGEYKYIDNETITFFIGSLKLPSTNATGRLSPADLSNSDDISNRSVVNIARLLQTLDEDGDPTNGITITEAAKNIANEYTTGLEDFVFDIPKEDFSKDPIINEIIKNGGQNTALSNLVSETDAINHLQSTLDNLSFDASNLSGLYELTFSFETGIHKYTFNTSDNTVNIIYSDGTNDIENWTVDNLGKLRITGSVDDTFMILSGTQNNGKLSVILSDEDGIKTGTGTIKKM
ncbi:MAG: hypothetical protein N4A49_01410 [Marinifilaceae bacterium]|jgi:hypothetical protein|nr:hypothetical protein [Marinifilaceae bacterium]